MSGHNEFDTLIEIAGVEDFGVRAWEGPTPFGPDEAPGSAIIPPREASHCLIVNEEDVTVRPWRRPTSTSARSGSGGTEPQAVSAVIQ